MSMWNIQTEIYPTILIDLIKPHSPPAAHYQIICTISDINVTTTETQTTNINQKTHSVGVIYIIMHIARLALYFG